jgi:hypothetical protein
MALQLDHILAGKGVWGGEIQGDTLIQYLSLGNGLLIKTAVVSVPRLQGLVVGNGLADRQGETARQTHNANTTAARGCGNGGDGIGLGAQV